MKTLNEFLLERAIKGNKLIDYPELFKLAYNNLPNKLKEFLDTHPNANIDIEDEYKATPLYGVQDSESTKILLDLGADIHHIDESSNTPFIQARYYLRTNVIITMLKYGANLQDRYHNQMKSYTMTPLMLASEGHDERLVNLYLYKDVNINEQNERGETALFYCVKRNPSINIARVLYEKEADINIKNIYGETAYDCALESGLKKKDIEFLKPKEIR